MQSQIKNREQKLKNFLIKHNKHLSKQVRTLWNQQKSQFQLSAIGSTIISDDCEEELKQAAKRLNLGGLVAFPTETVYGLGANALNEKALLKIYETKKRPLSDPIIVHILQPEDTFKYVQITEDQKKYFSILTKAFWPGPMTVILKVNLNVLPIVVTAQTGFVGIRCPNHPYFRKLLKESQLPIGAPSANLFSHVSPSESVHVFNDFYRDDVWIVDGGKCEFGVQSTVIKILDNSIKILREGSLSLNKIKQTLLKELGQNSPNVQIVKKTTNHEQNTEAPGQMLKHYSPYIPCEYIESPSQLDKLSAEELLRICLISFDRQTYGELAKSLGAYFEVGTVINLPANLQNEEEEKFCTIDQKIKMRQIYYLLRQAQNLPLSKIVVGWTGAKEGTIWDKIFRATEGKRFQPHTF